jgi:hypothetical protein
LLVRDEPDICQPPKSLGRIEADEAVSLARTNPATNVTSAKAKISLQSFMKK